MRVHADDELYRVDRTYLGPKRYRFPWRATYRAYGVWVLVVVAAAALMVKLGVPINFASVLALFVGSVLLTQRLMKSIDHDRPLRAIGVMVLHELTSPRPLTRRDRESTHLVTVQVSRWSHNAEPSQRWWSRVLRRLRYRKGDDEDVSTDLSAAGDGRDHVMLDTTRSLSTGDR